MSKIQSISSYTFWRLNTPFGSKLWGSSQWHPAHDCKGDSWLWGFNQELNENPQVSNWAVEVSCKLLVIFENRDGTRWRIIKGGKNRLWGVFQCIKGWTQWRAVNRKEMLTALHMQGERAKLLLIPTCLDYSTCPKTFSTSLFSDSQGTMVSNDGFSKKNNIPKP